tara:strand:+ start:776 stop:937 length:162 start_codon:yes stop_codon:yes gene_type:complete
MKQKNYYIFWGAITVAVVVPQVVAAFAYHKLADRLTKPIEVEIVEPSKLKLGL